MLSSRRVFTEGVTQDEAIVCAVCGRTPAAADGTQARLTWARGVEHGCAVWTCDRCSREHLRSIEGKLERAWW